jgi:hypothetical protein
MTKLYCYEYDRRGKSDLSALGTGEYNIEEGRFSCYNERTVPLLHRRMEITSTAEKAAIVSILFPIINQEGIDISIDRYF